MCKILPSYSSMMTTKAVNHCIKESNFPKLIALHVGYKVMLLMHIFPSFKLVNRSIGTVRDLFTNIEVGVDKYHCVIVDLKNILLMKNIYGAMTYQVHISR